MSLANNLYKEQSKVCLDEFINKHLPFWFKKIICDKFPSKKAPGLFGRFFDATEEYRVFGILHNTEGPARQYVSIFAKFEEEYFLYGVQYSKEAYIRKLNMDLI